MKRKIITLVLLCLTTLVFAETKTVQLSSKNNLEFIKIDSENSFYITKELISFEKFKEIMGEDAENFDSSYEKKFDRYDLQLIKIIYFCNRLSRVAGLEPAYYIDEGNRRNFDETTWKVRPSDRHIFYTDYPKLSKKKTGFRIPTEEEWKSAVYISDEELEKSFVNQSSKNALGIQDIFDFYEVINGGNDLVTNIGEVKHYQTKGDKITVYTHKIHEDLTSSSGKRWVSFRVVCNAN